MKKVFLFFVFTLLVSSAGFSQKQLRFGEVIIKDTLDGQVKLVDASTAFPSDLYVKDITTTGQINTQTILVEGGFLTGESAICAVQGNWEFYNPVIFDSEIQTDSIYAQDMVSLTTSRKIPVELVDLGGGSYDLIATNGDLFYIDGALSQDISITVISVSEGQTIKVFIQGADAGFMTPYTVTWSIHGSSGSELWLGGAPPQQSLNTDEYEFTRVNGTLYGKKMFDEYY